MEKRKRPAAGTPQGIDRKQIQPMGNISNRATGRKSSPTKTATGVCPRCRRRANITARDPVCSPCGEAIRRAAAAAQERDYLIAWLSSRVDARGHPLADRPHSERRQIVRLWRIARRARLSIVPDRAPAPLYFDARLAALMAPYKPASAAGRIVSPKGAPAAARAKHARGA